MGIETNDTRMSGGYVHLSHVMAHSVPLQFAPYIFHALSMQATLGFNTSLRILHLQNAYVINKGSQKSR